MRYDLGPSRLRDRNPRTAVLAGRARYIERKSASVPRSISPSVASSMGDRVAPVLVAVPVSLVSGDSHALRARTLGRLVALRARSSRRARSNQRHSSTSGANGSRPIIGKPSVRYRPSPGDPRPARRIAVSSARVHRGRAPVRHPHSRGERQFGRNIRPAHKRVEHASNPSKRWHGLQH